MQFSNNNLATWKNNKSPQRQALIVTLSLALLFFTIIATISFFSSLPKGQSIIEPINTSSDNKLEQFNSSLTSLALQTTLITNYNLSSEEQSNLKAIIRENTIKYETDANGKISQISFVIDLNQPKLTYIVDDQIGKEEKITISCAPIDLVQDLNTFCIDSNNQTTIDINLSKFLPYQGTTRNGIEYYIREDTNATINSQLTAYANICNKESNRTEVKSSIDYWLIQLGITNPDLIPIEIKDSGCKEDK